MSSEINSENTAVAATSAKQLTLDEVRTKLSGKTGKRYWRSLEELADTDEFHDMLQREFPRQSSEMVDAVSRRGFMKLMGASLALAGVTGCTKQPDEKIFPYVAEPDELVLGKPMYFATAFPFSTGALPLLVKSDAFRPIKIEGNPDHPMSKGTFGGGSDPISQGTLLDLYDPFRSQDVLYRGATSTWPEFAAAFTRALEAKKGSGQGIYVLSSVVTSPTLAAQAKAAKAALPGLEWLQWDAVNRDNVRRASMDSDAKYNLENADVIVSLDADFLGGIAHPGFLSLARQYARRRKLEIDPEKGISTTTMNRMYVIETHPSTTGMKAEHRLALHPAAIDSFAQALAGGGAASGLSPEAQQFLTALQADLKAHGGSSVVIPGDNASPAVHAAAKQLNDSLGNTGKTVTYGAPIAPMPAVCADDITKLAQALAAGQVEWLIILGANPVYDAPADLNFDQALRDAMSKTQVVHLGYHNNETAQYSTWHIPQASYLETWTDAIAYDGTVSIVQPMIAPLFNGRSAHEIVQLMLNQPYSSPMDAVRANWPQLKQDAAWRKALHQGWIDGATADANGGTAAGGGAAAGGGTGAGNPAAASQTVSPDQLVVVFRPDPHVYDGRYASVGWLQEIPKPVTKLAWDNAALISIPTAGKLGVVEGDIIEIISNGRKIEAPVALSYGAADNTITVYLGGGRTHAGPTGTGVGFNAYPLRTSTALNYAPASVKKTGRTYDVLIARSHYTDDRGKLAGGDGKRNHSLEGNEAEDRSIIRAASLADFQKNPNFALEGSEMRETPPKDETLLYNWNYQTDSKGRRKYAWGMAIDQNSCIGCNACVASCYAENNIPVVGYHQAKVGRIMQWIRVDTYFEGDLDAPKAHFQPMLCQHCENAGCEQVCPVAATVHTPEGLNQMVYNRCVGTRYCSNNCPYKVRRFNWLLYSDYDTESLKFMRNPDVSVRSRGVMEKCTYCVQRIEAAKIEADKENRSVRDGEIVTACQQACPTDAIVFGDINDPNSMVSQRKRSTRNYPVLGDLNYRPRTTYIAEVFNPNPEMTGEAG